MQIYCNKRQRFHKKTVQLPKDWFGTQHGGSDVMWKISKLVPRVLWERKTLDNNDLNQVVASSGFSENKGMGGGVLCLADS